jgi:hypothetical protein
VTRSTGQQDFRLAAHTHTHTHTRHTHTHTHTQKHTPHTHTHTHTHTRHTHTHTTHTHAHTHMTQTHTHTHTHTTHTRAAPSPTGARQHDRRRLVWLGDDRHSSGPARRLDRANHCGRAFPRRVTHRDFTSAVCTASNNPSRPLRVSRGSGAALCTVLPCGARVSPRVLPHASDGVGDGDRSQRIQPILALVARGVPFVRFFSQRSTHTHFAMS